MDLDQLDAQRVHEFFRHFRRKRAARKWNRCLRDAMLRTGLDSLPATSTLPAYEEDQLPGDLDAAVWHMKLSGAG